MFKNLERAPEIIPLFEEAEIEEKGIKGRAARYVMESGQLFVNMQYPAIAEMRAQLETEYADGSDPETMRSLGACLRIRCFRRLESDSIPGHEQDISRLEPGSGSSAAALGA
jgi:hypothetical protein